MTMPKTAKKRQCGQSDIMGNNQVLTFLGAVEKRTVLGRIADLNDLSTSQQLHNETRSNDGRDSQLHQRSSVGGQNDTYPVEGIG